MLAYILLIDASSTFTYPETLSPLNLNRFIMLVQNCNTLLQARQPRLELHLNQFLVITELLVERISVRTGPHGEGEYWADHDPVVLLERVSIGFGEGGGEFLGAVGLVVAQGLRGEVESSV